MDCYNTIRSCGLARFAFYYWCENVYTDRDKLSITQRRDMVGAQEGLAEWMISTSGFFDKSVRGNWPPWNEWIKASSMPGGVIVHTDREEIFKSVHFQEYKKRLYEILINRKNDNIRGHFALQEITSWLRLPREVPELFCDTLLRDSDRKEEIKQWMGSQGSWEEMNEVFQRCYKKNVLIINLFADVIRDHYNSGKISEGYNKLKEEAPLHGREMVVPEFNSISSVEIPYPFGNGMNVAECSNFFEMLDSIKTRLDHPSTPDFDIAIISAGAYTPFIAEFMESRGKGFFCFGRFICDIFLIDTKFRNFDFFDTFPVLKPYMCNIPERYRAPGFEGVENGGYW